MPCFPNQLFSIIGVITTAIVLPQIQIILNKVCWTIAKSAKDKREAYEEILDILENRCILFNGDNVRSIWNRDLTQLELEARRTIHDDFKINCEEQPHLYGNNYSYKVDGLVETEGKSIVLEYDGPYHHSRVEQKEKDSYKDFKLTEYGGYTVLRIPSDIIYNNKSHFKTLLLDALYNVKHVKRFSKEKVVPVNQAVPLTPTKG